MRTRSMKQQLNYAITQNVRIGESKRAYLHDENQKKLEGQVFSIGLAEALRSTARSFGDYMKSQYPDIKRACDIQSEHVNAYIRARGGGWSRRTLITKIGHLNILQKQLNNTYKVQTEKWKIEPPAGVERADIVRNKAMEKSDLDALRASMAENENSNSRIGLEVAARCGLRAKEIARLHADNIDIQNKCIHVVNGAKNGRRRDVPIREKDVNFFNNIKARGGYVCGGIHEDSINRNIRKHMKKLGMDEKYPQTLHAIRKAYVKERMEELRPFKDERSAWCAVQSEIGHGHDFRQALYNVYVGQ